MTKPSQAGKWKERPFFRAVFLSLLWHFFWFFSVTIIVSPPAKLAKPVTRVSSLGAVLEDSIFKTLVQNRSETSQTFYRRPSDLLPALDPEVKTLERHSPGDLVSVPFAGELTSSAREMIGGLKAVPDDDFVAKSRLGGSDANQEGS